MVGVEFYHQQFDEDARRYSRDQQADRGAFTYIDQDGSHVGFV